MGKVNGSYLISQFTLPFRQFLPGKGNIFRRFPLFSLPFLLLASLKGNGSYLVSQFTLPLPTPHQQASHPFQNFLPLATPQHSHQTQTGLPHEFLRAAAPSVFCYYIQIVFYLAFTLAFFEMPLKILPSPLFLKARTL